MAWKIGDGAGKLAVGDGLAFVCCTVVNLWLALPFMITIIDGAPCRAWTEAFMRVPCWGANWPDRARYITIPMIRPIIAPSVIITVFTTFKQFDVIYLLTQQAGGKTGAHIHTILPMLMKMHL